MDWWARWGSNPRPSGYEPHALTPELQAPPGEIIPRCCGVIILYRPDDVPT